MICNENELKPKEIIIPHKPINIPNVSFTGDRRLLLSDNPETIDNSCFNTAGLILWHDRVQSLAGSVKHRVYGWHVNDTGNTFKIGVTVENFAQGKLIIKNLKEVKALTKFSNFYMTNVGRPVAMQCLKRSLNSIQPIDNGISEVGVLTEYYVNNTCLVGFILEFEVVSSCPLDYAVRVVAAQNTKIDLRSITSNLAANDGKHYRGSWEYADVTGTTQTYNVGETIAISISNGITDNIQLAADSFDSINATHNPGHYGAIYKVRIPVFKRDPCVKTVEIGVTPRGGDYTGAAKVPIGTFNLPHLKVSSPNYATVMHYRPPTGLSYVDLSFMHAGAASMPIAIYLTTL